MLHSLFQLWLDLVRDWGYGGVVVLMAMESSIFPVPSEVVVPPAAFLAATGGGMSFWGVVIAGTVGSYLGSAITYGVARWAGRAVVARWGRWCFCPPGKLDRAERWLGRYAAGGIFFARLLPVVRHLISIPAGLVRMPFGMFSAMTLAGAFLWCWILAWFGQRVGQRNPQAMENPEALIAAVKHEVLWIVLACAALCALYVLVVRLTAERDAPAAEPAAGG